MSQHRIIDLKSERYLSMEIDRCASNIKKCKKKLEHPINERTGKPLAATTIKKYQRNLEDFEMRFQKLDRVAKGLSDSGIRSLIPVKFGNDFYSFFDDIVDIKESISKRSSFYADDLINMINFIFDQQKCKNNIEILVTSIVKSFIHILELIINENCAESQKVINFSSYKKETSRFTGQWPERPNY